MSFFDPYTFPEIISFLMRGLGTTLIIALVSIILSFFFGAILGLARFSSKGIPGIIATCYIDFVRNVPVLIYILFFRLAMPTYIGSFRIPHKQVVSAIIAMTVFTSSMTAEIIRGGLNGVPKGQWEAANSLGFSKFQVMRLIILPQAIRNILIPMMGQFVSCLKDTSLCQVIGVGELLMNCTVILGRFKYSTQVIVVYAIVAAIYYIVDVSLIKVSKRIKF